MSSTNYPPHLPPGPPPQPPIIPPKDGVEQEIIIAVMGVTGTGKSYFIKEVSGISDVVVSNGLHSCTASVQPYSFLHAGAKITLIDTPGFNDTTKTDTEVLADICAWTSLNYRKGRLLSGIIYLHRITDVRMDGSSLKNLRMFQRLCGPGALKNVLLTTTQWSNVDPALGEFREDNLRHGDFWGGLVSKGASLERFMGTRESGLGLINKLMENEPKALNIQYQMVQKNMTLVETSAGKFINEELIALERKHQENLENLEKERQKAVKEKDDEMKEILAQEQAKAREKLEKAAAEKKLLADIHAAEMKKREEAERRREEERERNERAVIAVAAKDISVMAHLKCMFTSYDTRGRLIYDIDDTREFVKDSFPITIHYQFNFLAGIEVCVKTIAEIFDAGMGINNYVKYNGGYYRCKGEGCVKRGSQKFVIFRRV
ncbi:hypothetical protein C7212DRAFT_275951 [Tuber magnatum]|uniref:G domain-containing protein n=1 Tax=Tuber magnatum TaxID=42249 RepID=A0A317SYW2_9PEZI|nr:hypothetical protein C7212DRAFT_275951 [Tuber magnatum]